MERATKIFLLFVFSFIFMSGCTQQEDIQINEDDKSSVKIEEIKKTQETTPEETPTVIEEPQPKTIQSSFPSGGLGSLCSDEKECLNFCLNNREHCESYCEGKPENELCKIIFPLEEDLEKEVPPITKEVKDEDKKCAGTKTKFDHAPVNLDKTELFLPLGLMTVDHVTPIDHHYFYNFDNTKFDIEVYSPGKGTITGIGPMPGAKAGEDYRIEIQHTCTISSVYIYVSRLPEKLSKPLEGHPEGAYVEIPVQTGELIGYYKNGLDYNLVDQEVHLPGFIVPEHYGEIWKTHVPNTYDYFNEPVRSKLIAKNPRTAEPISGKIDYDIDGKLVGNWFWEEIEIYEQGRGHLGELSLVYDYIDPQRIVISIGGYGGEDSRQFGIKGNSPDPADINVEDGLIAYELVEYDYKTPSGNYWDRISLVKNLKTVSNEMVQGVVLVQMIENRKIKFETFPGKTVSQVSGFTNNAKIYER